MTAAATRDLALQILVYEDGTERVSDCCALSADALYRDFCAGCGSATSFHRTCPRCEAEIPADDRHAILAHLTVCPETPANVD